MGPLWHQDPSGEASDPTLLARAKAGWEATPLWRWYGIQVERAAEGRCRLFLRVQPGMVNADDRTLHGGVIVTLIDAAVGAALWTVYEVGKDIQGHTTTELNVSYLEGVLTPEVYAEGRIVRRGRTLVVGEAQVLDAVGKLCAMGRATYMVFR